MVKQLPLAQIRQRHLLAEYYPKYIFAMVHPLYLCSFVFVGVCCYWVSFSFISFFLGHFALIVLFSLSNKILPL